MPSRHQSAKSAKAGKPAEEFTYATGQSSLGAVLVALSELGIVAVIIDSDAACLPGQLRARFPVSRLRQDGELARTALARIIEVIEDPFITYDLPLDLRGSPFQQQVWRTVMQIPAGETSTYAEIARLAGSPRAMRAVGSACTNNPLSMLVPCHRVLHTGASKSAIRQKTWVAREIKPAG